METGMKENINEFNIFSVLFVNSILHKVDTVWYSFIGGILFLDCVNRR